MNILNNPELKPCECNCGELIPIINKRGEFARYKHGHNWRGKTHKESAKLLCRISKLGELNPNYKNGKTIDNKGYVRVLISGVGYVKEHRLVYEKYYNCCLLNITDIHHINGNRKDNRIENLQPLYHWQHTQFHHAK